MTIQEWNDGGISARIGQERATREREATGSFACPICGVEESHPHEDSEIVRWIEAQVGRFNIPGWVLVKGTDKPALSSCPYCRRPPLALADRDCGLWSYEVRCGYESCMVHPLVWHDTSEGARAKWEALVSASGEEFRK